MVATRGALQTGANVINAAQKGYNYVAKALQNQNKPYANVKKQNKRKIQKKHVNEERMEIYENPHSLQTTAFTKKAPSKLAKYIKISPPAYYSWNDQNVFTGTQGQQYFFTLPRELFQYSMIQTALNQTADSATSETSLFLEHVQQTTMITNFSGATNEVCIWELLVKDNLASGFSPTQTIQAGYNAKYNISGSTAPSATAGEPYTRLFQNPLESEVFRQYYKVEKTIKFTLPPGTTHKHRKYVEYNKMWKNTYASAGAIGGGGSAPAYIKGWTRLTMIQVNGVAVTSGTGVTSASKPELAVLNVTNVKYRTPQGRSTNASLGNIATTAFDSATAMKNMVAESGVLTTVT